ncbi:hypothetical protein EDB89DRAFT_1511714 [Lactarius sanguifluus]|nr:hypothetical protein EDB89DRAFT_1511714 [Lactarius sanguifluus]
MEHGPARFFLYSGPVARYPLLHFAYHAWVLIGSTAGRHIEQGSNARHFLPRDCNTARSDGTDRLPILEVHPLDLQGLRHHSHLPVRVAVVELCCDICHGARSDQQDGFFRAESRGPDAGSESRRLLESPKNICLQGTNGHKYLSLASRGRPSARLAEPEV